MFLLAPQALLHAAAIVLHCQPLPPASPPAQALLMAVELYAAAAIIWESIHTFMPPLIGGSESMTDPVRTPWQGLFGSAASGGPLTASAAAAEAAARQLEL